MLRLPLPTWQKDSWFLLFGALGCLLCLFLLLERSWWLLSVLVMLAWVPFIITNTQVWLSRDQWMAVLFLFLIGQSGHMIEHCAQMVQLHLLGLPPSQANGILGMLNVEWIHFLWNTIEFVASVLCLFLFTENRWSWALVLMAFWHELEHIAIMSVYLRTHIPGSPGLLARGGMIGGGLPLLRPDLHFLYVLIEQILICGLYLTQKARYHSSQIPYTS